MSEWHEYDPAAKPSAVEFALIGFEGGMTTIMRVDDSWPDLRQRLAYPHQEARIFYQPINVQTRVAAKTKEAGVDEPGR